MSQHQRPAVLDLSTCLESAAISHRCMTQSVRCFLFLIETLAVGLVFSCTFMLGQCVMLDQTLPIQKGCAFQHQIYENPCIISGCLGTHPIQLVLYSSVDSVKQLYLEKFISSLLPSNTMVFASHACFGGSGTSKTRAMRRMTASGTLRSLLRDAFLRKATSTGHAMYSCM